MMLAGAALKRTVAEPDRCGRSSRVMGVPHWVKCPWMLLVMPEATRLQKFDATNLPASNPPSVPGFPPSPGVFLEEQSQAPARATTRTEIHSRFRVWRMGESLRTTPERMAA